jgi:hypothetical protein
VLKSRTTIVGNGFVPDALDGAVDPRVLPHRAQVGDAAGREIVEHADLVTARQERLREVRSNEAGSARDERTHCDHHRPLRP